MRLKNKKTGEMGIVSHFDNQSIVIYPVDENWNAKGDKKYIFHSLAELNAEWEDYEEPKDKGYWYIDDLCRMRYSSELLDEIDDRPNNWMIRKLCGNYFDTREEAEKAAEKLKAWKRLKEARFAFGLPEYTLNEDSSIIGATGSVGYSCLCYEDFEKDLDLLFGGGE